MRWYLYMMAGLLGLGGFVQASAAGSSTPSKMALGHLSPARDTAASDDLPSKSSERSRDADALPTPGPTVRFLQSRIGNAARLNLASDSWGAVAGDASGDMPRRFSSAEDLAICGDATLQSRSVRLQI